MTEKEAIRKSVEHWERMVEWAEKQDEENPTYHSLMQNDIGEWWSGYDCSLCQKYDPFHDDGSCINCKELEARA